MVSLVLVSHSEQLAAGLRQLAEQMVQGTVQIATAAGIDDPENPLGTDATRVYTAIKSVYSDDGVVMLMDLGSAILSAETALDMLTPEQREKVHLSPAPFIEGTLAAAVQASLGSDVDQVLSEAETALTGKSSQLGVPAPSAPSSAAPAPAEAEMHEVRLTIHNRLGLHARPAARFVSTAGQFQSQIRVRNVTADRGPVSAKSINQVATLGVGQGDDVVVSAEGPDAAEALAALQDLVAANFGEDEAEALTPPVATKPEVSETIEEGVLTGIAASSGIAIGPVAQYRVGVPEEVPLQQSDDPDAEWERLQTALRTARGEIQTLRIRTAAQAGEQEASIFDAHRLFLEDPALVDAARDRIFDAGLTAESAWQASVDEMVEQYRAIENEYLRARAADVVDVGQRVLRVLAGSERGSFELTEPAVLIAAELTPSDTAQLNRSKVMGICTARGGATSHSAILARALGIPAVVGIGPEIRRVEDGTTVALDGEAGKMWIDPDADVLQELESRRKERQTRRDTLQAAGRAPAVTKDGVRVEVVANVRGLADTQSALDYGAEGVGLLRTEFLYLDRATAPSEDEQVQAYTAIADVLEERPLIIRTLDVGGDKPLPYVEAGHEENPFLGQRGIRFTLHHRDMLKTQLRAILRASPGHNIKIMFPVVASVGEVRAAKAILAEAQDGLRTAGVPFDDSIEVGIMIEVPAAVVAADQLACEVDFFSIGSNDLSQYVMAADRTNERVADLVDAFQPAVLRMIRQTIVAGKAAGVWVGLCGELAGDPLAVPILLGFGLDEFSMNPPAIPDVKRVIGRLTIDETKAIAEAVLSCESAGAVREYVAARLGE